MSSIIISLDTQDEDVVDAVVEATQSIMNLVPTQSVVTTVCPATWITLLYVCEEAEHTPVALEQPLADIVEVGTLICPECGEDMELLDEVRVS